MTLKQQIVKLLAKELKQLGCHVIPMDVSIYVYSSDFDFHVDVWVRDDVVQCMARGGEPVLISLSDPDMVSKVVGTLKEWRDLEWWNH